MDREQARAAPIGQRLPWQELNLLYEYFYGGIAWPSKEHPGFAVVIGVVEEGRRNREPREVHVLQECEGWDIRELLQQCKVFYRDLRCEPRWVSNQPNAAAEQILRELNKDGGYGSNFWPGPTTLFADDPNPCPYAYLLPKIKSMLDRDDKRLFLKGSKVSHYLSSIPPDQLAVLEPGAYPAIEALGYAIVDAHPRVEVLAWYEDPDDLDDDLDDGPAVMARLHDHGA